MAFEVNRLGERFAAEIVGIDLAQPLSDGEFAAIRDAWFQAGVVVFRDQHLAPAGRSPSAAASASRSCTS